MIGLSWGATQIQRMTPADSRTIDAVKWSWSETCRPREGAGGCKPDNRVHDNTAINRLVINWGADVPCACRFHSPRAARALTLLPVVSGCARRLRPSGSPNSSEGSSVGAAGDGAPNNVFLHSANASACGSVCRATAPIGLMSHAAHLATIAALQEAHHSVL